jgi:hypothetical protein
MRWKPEGNTCRNITGSYSTGSNVCGAGVRFKWGFEPAKTDATPGDAASQGGEGKGGLDAGGVGLEEGESADASAPLPPLEWMNEDRAGQLAMWRAAPEKWAALAEVSRQCLLRAMGVDSLNAEQ